MGRLVPRTSSARRVGLRRRALHIRRSAIRRGAVRAAMGSPADEVLEGEPSDERRCGRFLHQFGSR